MASVVSFLPTADRRCSDCGCKRAVPDSIAKRDPALAIVATRECTDCGYRVEVSTDVLESVVPESSSCDECGCIGSHARAEVELPEGMGTGYVLLCDDCIARYDEGAQAWAG